MKIAVGLLVLIGITIVGIFYITPSATGQKRSADDAATPVRRGNVTPREREYSKEYKRLYGSIFSKKLTELAKDIKKKRQVNGEEIGISMGVPSVPSFGSDAPTAQEFIQQQVCKADTVVFGRVKNRASHLTEDETFIYTEYEFAVKNILKNDSALAFASGDVIQITRPGGLIDLEGQLIRAEDESYEALKLDHEYVLFLRYIPSTKGYIVLDEKSDFELESNSFRSLSKQGTPLGFENINRIDTFLPVVESARSAGCRHERGGN